MWAELADKARRQQERLADGDTINVGRYRRYADLVRPEVSDEPAVGRAPVRAGWPRWTAARR
jgi:hypothetical protein